jgi:hypothetical protein
MKDENLLPRKTIMPLCVRNAVLLENSSVRVLKIVSNVRLQSNRVIVDQPSKPISRIFSFQL